MTDELRKIYQIASKMDRYSDSKTPSELYRGYKKGAKVGLMVPTLIGFVSAKRGPRHPDVLVKNVTSGFTPQYQKGTVSEDLITEGKNMPITIEMIRSADQYIVKGCRTLNGEHRGLSLFNTANFKLPFDWFLIEKNTEIPKGLAVIRDADATVTGMVHYTVAPKDDMSLALYLVQLKTLGERAVAVKH